MAPSPLSDPGNVAFLQPFCRSSVAQSSFLMVAASMAPSAKESSSTGVPRTLLEKAVPCSGS